MWNRRLAITTIVIAQVLFAVVGLVKLYDPSAEVLVGIQFVLATALSTVSTAAWMVR
ncbi:hypothetical protein [Haloarcula sebkhae]|uniref:Uncharacterized protein n=2 Tax=Haloarcula sebkhae TaxID=932660 RepID=A0A830F4U2_9EURY|nr:hypothetical protein [Haloarcula sebkhae]GGK83856.1 hypothetical protein GCM10009067_39970 [Haloarcula sebkhae]